MRIYDQNIWGNFSAEGQYVANRNRLIKEMIFDVKPEFCCFQECNPYTSRSGAEPIQEILKTAYVEIKPEYFDKNYTPLFYDPKRVDVMECGYFPFEGFNDLDSKSASWGVFKELSTCKTVSVLSTHFWWKAESAEDEMQRRKNAKAIAKLAKEIDKKHGCPMIVCGDLNSGDTEQGIGGYDEMLKTGFKDVRFISDKSDNSYTCCTVYPICENGKYINGEQPNQTIDYILAYNAEQLKAKEFLVMNTEKSRASSDHLPLIFNFELI